MNHISFYPSTASHLLSHWAEQYRADRRKPPQSSSLAAVAALLLGTTFCAVSLAQSAADEQTRCSYYVLPKVVLTNATDALLQSFTVGYKVDGKEKGTFPLRTALDAFQSQVVALPPLPLIQGMSTFSIYLKERSADEVSLDWADYQRPEKQRIASAVFAADSKRQAEHTDDCNCLKAADATYSQVNLWVYQTGSTPRQAQLMASIDKGKQWVRGRATDPASTCSETIFAVNDKLGEAIRLLVTSTAQEDAPESEQTADLSAPSEADELLAHPNPLRQQTTLRYALQHPEEVTLELQDISGKRMAVLMNKQQQAAGAHTFVFRPSNLAKGTYLLTLTTQNEKRSVKIVLY